MALRCAVEMGDIFAAIVEASGSIGIDTVFNPIRDLPITYQLGNSDDGWTNGGPDIPLESFEDLVSNLPAWQRIINTHLNTFNFDPAFTVSGDPNLIMKATFPGIPNTVNRSFNFILIKGLGHNYPNGKNHPLE